jgi:ArsR family transcriptional regulator
MKMLNVLKALGDETRLRLVNLCLQYELNVNEIVSILEMGQSRISRHLKILSENNILKFRRDGLWTFYSAATSGREQQLVKSLKDLFFLDGVFLEDLERARQKLAEISTKTASFFNAIAEDWEKLKREIIGPTDLEGKILKFLPEEEIVADLGCGTGDLLESIKKKAGKIIGVDKSSIMLEKARQRFSGDKQIQFRIGELEHLPLSDREADAVVISMVLHHLVEPSKVFHEADRVLKKGKVFVIVDLVTHDNEMMRTRFGDRWLGFSMKQIKEWLRDSHFEIANLDYFNLKKGLKGFIIKSIKTNKK